MQIFIKYVNNYIIFVNKKYLWKLLKRILLTAAMITMQNISH